MKIYITADADGRVSLHDSPPVRDAQGTWATERGCTDSLSDLPEGGVFRMVAERLTLAPSPTREKPTVWELTASPTSAGAEWQPLVPADGGDDDGDDDGGEQSLDPLNVWKAEKEDARWYDD